MEPEPLRVGIDVSPLALTRAGTARHIRSLLELLGEDPALRIRRYALGGSSRALVPVRDLGWYLAALPLRARRDGVDVLHCPTHRAPVRSAVPLVVTFHDLAVLRHPDTFNPWTRTYSRLALPGVAKAARRLIAVSEFTKRELRDLLDVPEDKVRVIPNAVGPPFEERGAAAAGDYVLAVSTLEPRKNLPRLVEAYQRADLNGLKLLVAGAPGWGGVRVEGDGIRWLGEVQDEELARLYRGARCVAYVSLYEGFGLPMLEAMACGAPVLAGHNEAAEEVSGGAAVLVDPLDPAAIAAGIAEAIDRREELRERGLERARAFDWHEVARATAEVYRAAAA
jgi:glycosyltransferase involved in cell wall biosynthesis